MRCSRGGNVGIYGGSFGTITPSFDYAGRAGNTEYFFTGRGFTSNLGIENPTDIATLHRAHQHIVELGREAAEVFGAELTTRHAGTMIVSSEWLRALEIEIARVSSPGILPPSTAIPALPGGRVYTTGGNPANAAPLTEVMAQANIELTRRIVAKPLPETKAEKPKPVVADKAAPVPPRAPDRTKHRLLAGRPPGDDRHCTWPGWSGRTADDGGAYVSGQSSYRRSLRA
ncbi:MAG TPA: hypothetical protein VFC54_11105 [Pseudolabrys sp.]|nr:hypothetical protein [Pseudolabrys sp.]